MAAARSIAARAQYKCVLNGTMQLMRGGRFVLTRQGAFEQARKQIEERKITGLVECLPSKHEALSSNPSTTPPKERKKERSLAISSMAIDEWS
jgi:hypothetical protein